MQRVTDEVEGGVPARASGALVVVQVVVLLLLVVVLAASTVVTLFAWHEASDDCSLGLEFERTSSELLEHRGFPPREVCRFRYDSGVEGAPIHPPEVEETDAAPALLVTMFLAVVLVVYAGWLLRRASAHAKASTLRMRGAAEL